MPIDWDKKAFDATYILFTDRWGKLQTEAERRQEVIPRELQPLLKSFVHDLCSEIVQQNTLAQKMKSEKTHYTIHETVTRRITTHVHGAQSFKLRKRAAAGHHGLRPNSL